jgi:hypothetical protein
VTHTVLGCGHALRRAPRGRHRLRLAVSGGSHGLWSWAGAVGSIPEGHPRRPALKRPRGRRSSECCGAGGRPGGAGCGGDGLAPRRRRPAEGPCPRGTARWRTDQRSAGSDGGGDQPCAGAGVLPAGGTPRFVETSTRTVRISDCHLPGFHGDRMRTEGILDLTGCVIEGTICLQRAHVIGPLPTAERHDWRQQRRGCRRRWPDRQRRYGV